MNKLVLGFLIGIGLGIKILVGLWLYSKIKEWWEERGYKNKRKET